MSSLVRFESCSIVHILTLALVIGNIEHTYISGGIECFTGPLCIPLPYVHHQPQATSPHLPRPLSPSIDDSLEQKVLTFLGVIILS